MEIKEGGPVNIWEIVGKPSGICLHIGCGNDIQDGFINIDKFNDYADVDWDIFNLPLKNDSVNTIVCGDVLEHFGKFEVPKLLKEWCRVLKVGAPLYLIVPDIISACQRVIEDPDNDMHIAFIYGNQLSEGQFHKSGFTYRRLNNVLTGSGFNAIKMAGYMSMDNCGRILVEAKK